MFNSYLCVYDTKYSQIVSFIANKSMLENAWDLEREYILLGNAHSQKHIIVPSLLLWIWALQCFQHKWENCNHMYKKHTKHAEEGTPSSAVWPTYPLPFLEYFCCGHKIACILFSALSLKLKNEQLHSKMVCLTVCVCYFMWFGPPLNACVNLSEAGSLH